MEELVIFLHIVKHLLIGWRTGIALTFSLSAWNLYHRCGRRPPPKCVGVHVFSRADNTTFSASHVACVYPCVRNFAAVNFCRCTIWQEVTYWILSYWLALWTGVKLTCLPCYNISPLSSRKYVDINPYPLLMRLCSALAQSPTGLPQISVDDLQFSLPDPISSNSPVWIWVVIRSWHQIF